MDSAGMQSYLPHDENGTPFDSPYFDPLSHPLSSNPYVKGNLILAIWIILCPLALAAGTLCVWGVQGVLLFGFDYIHGIPLFMGMVILGFTTLVLTQSLLRAPWAHSVSTRQPWQRTTRSPRP